MTAQTEGVKPARRKCSARLGLVLIISYVRCFAIYGQGANSAGGMESLFFLPAVMAFIFAGWPMTSRSAYGFSVSWIGGVRDIRDRYAPSIFPITG
jgi:hypothetical protein